MGTSKRFLQGLARLEDEMGLPSGIGPMESDFAQVEPDRLAAFLGVLLERLAASSRTAAAALSGDEVSAEVLVLGERAGVSLPWPAGEAGWEQAMRDRVRNAARHMGAR